MDEGFDTELFKAYVRERGLGQGQVSSLPFEDFYSRLRDRLNSLRSKGEAAQQQYRKVYMTAMDLITLRMGKILNAVAGGESAALLMDRIVPEERELLRQIIPLVSDWKKRVLGENP
jgi:DNA replication initiation complex subunit (GINS family)